MKPAARLTDPHECSMPTPKPHVGGPIVPPCSSTVIIDGYAAARATDCARCQVPGPNFIVTGSATVSFDRLPAARVDDHTMHPPPGRITAGSPNVFIGGPTVGVMLGAAGAKAACEGAASGRDSKRTKQTYQNCGIESSRQIINQATRKNVDEDTLLDDALDQGYAEREDTRSASGGTNPDDRRDILDRHGVPSNLEDANLASLQQALADGKGVITSHDAGLLWNDKGYLNNGHAILVTGVQYDTAGKAETIYYNDTGSGVCGASLSAGKFIKSLRSGRDMNVTADPIW